MPFLGFLIRERKKYLFVANAKDFYENDKSIRIHHTIGNPFTYMGKTIINCKI